jgi:hypothetical protein
LHNNSTASFPWRLFKKLIFSIVFLLGFSWSAAQAQSDDESQSFYGISIGSDYDVPVGNFAYTFKPAINFNLNLQHQYGDFTTSVSFGYHVYKPKMDTFYYAVTNADYGTEVYQNFPVYSFYLGGAYNLKLADQLKVYGGIDFGVYLTHYQVESNDFTEDSNQNLHQEDLYMAARLGFTYMLTDHVGLGLEGKYNFFLPTGSTDDYDSMVGTMYNSWSVGVRLIYNF